MQNNFEKQICLVLSKHNFQAFFVGGAIRDMLMKKQPKDIDIATDATPKQVTKIFSKTSGLKVIPIGKRFGTVQVMDKETNNFVEITTFRTEQGYSDNRHPDKVNFVKTIKEDLSRRDFTINAVAYNPLKEEIYDPYGGVTDILNKVLRTVGKPEERFKEDPLRMLRLFRFQSRYGFVIEANTFKTVSKFAYLIKKISSDRIREEILKILNGKYLLLVIIAMKETKLLKYILPELHKVFEVPQPTEYHKHKVGHHSLITAQNVANKLRRVKIKNPLLVFSALIHDIGKLKMNENAPYFPEHTATAIILLDNIFQRLNFSNEQQKYIRFMVTHHMDFINYLNGFTRKTLRRYLSRVENTDYLFDLQILNVADTNASGFEKIHDLERLNDFYIELYRELLKKPALSVTDLDISGKDLLELGIPAKPILGKILDKLLKRVINDQTLNNREELLKLAKEEYLRLK